MHKKINVLYDATVLINGTANAPARSGVYFVVYNILIEMLKREDFNVTLYCEKKQANLVLEIIKKDEILRKVPIAEYSNLDKLIIKWEKLKYDNKINQGNKIIRVFIKTILKLLNLFSNLINTLNINNTYKKLFSNFDIFFEPCGGIPIEIKNVRNIKKYSILYDIIPIIFPENYPEMKNKKSWFYKLIKSLNKNDFYFAISDYTKQDYIKNIKDVNPNNITSIPLSTGLMYERENNIHKINSVKEKYNIPKDKKYLFSLCTLEPRKNLIFAVKNFIEFVKRNNINDFVFVMGGGHWDLFIQKLDDSIDNLQEYKDKIIKIGYVDDEDMSALYSGAEMFVFPSVYEGFGMPILEAMKCGCPVITSNVTSMPEVIGDCGIQINPEDDEDLIKAFEKMYFDNDFRQKYIEKGIERGKEFTWERCVDIITNEIIKNG